MAGELNPAAVEAVATAVDAISPDYSSLLARHRKVQAPIVNRVSVDFGGSTQRGMAAEELIIAQRTVPGYAPALLEKMFDMGRKRCLSRPKSIVELTMSAVALSFGRAGAVLLCVKWSCCR